MTYAILECNMERLTKKLTTIKNKCEKYGIEFHFEEVGEEFRTIKNENDEEEVLRYVLVEAEGKAEQSGWEFVASLDHTDKGNIISGTGNIEVPERYYNADCVCEHCNSRRNRKNTYIVYNAEKQEFKQVGKSCLKDFTHGLDAEGVAQYISGWDELIKGETPYSGCHSTRYFEVKEMLAYFNETIKHFGYVSNAEARYGGGRSTSERASFYYDITHGRVPYGIPMKVVDETREELKKVNFNVDSEENKAKVNAMVEWVLSNPSNSNYFHNLKVVVSTMWISEENFGLVASIPATYDKTLEIEAEKRRRELEAKADESNSKWIGEVGKRITFKVDSARVLSTRYTEWGETYFIKFRDTDGNIIVWSTSNGNVIEAKEIIATVKEHSEYNNVKQTIVTRGKVLS